MLLEIMLNICERPCQSIPMYFLDIHVLVGSDRVTLAVPEGNWTGCWVVFGCAVLLNISSDKCVRM